MATMLINSREVLKKLENAGFKKEQADAVTQVLEDIDVSSLATKLDLVQLETRLVKFLYVQAGVIIGLTVTLVKLL